jgi:SAM-dependent methyltransferase
MMPCPICGETQLDVIYHGPIRMGRFKDRSGEPYAIQHCAVCDTAWLEKRFFDYAQPEYREQVDGTASIEDYHRIHDRDQVRALNEVGTDQLRGRCVADIGCGGGAFLDLIKGLASHTVGIEPAVYYHEALRAKGHDVHHSIEGALPRYEGRVDLAVSFSVIEHVDDPVELLEQAGRLLKPGGRLIISTPSRGDWMLQLLPDEYGSFFYRAAHRWYLTADSLKAVAVQAGFKQVKVWHRHRFGLSNLLLWLRDRKPTGQRALEVPPILDAAFIGAMNEAGLGDYLYAELRKDEAGVGE